jgi:hypothetical protein
MDLYWKLPDKEDWEQYLCDNFTTKTVDDRVVAFANSISEMAKEFVNPTFKEPQTPTEENLVVMLTTFGSICVLKLLENLIEITSEIEEVEEEEVE